MFDRLFGAAPQIPSANVRETWTRLSDAKAKAVLIDVRETFEFNRGHAKGAKSLPLSQLGKRFKEIPRDREVYIICQSGNRSGQAVMMLQRQGYDNTKNVVGGTITWQAQRLPMD